MEDLSCRRWIRPGKEEARLDGDGILPERPLAVMLDEKDRAWRASTAMIEKTARAAKGRINAEQRSTVIVDRVHNWNWPLAVQTDRGDWRKAESCGRRDPGERCARRQESDRGSILRHKSFGQEDRS